MVSERKKTEAEFKSVTPDMETAPVADSGDAADDPAIWIHPSDPSRSLIIGSNKQSGIAVYDLNGTEVAFYPVGKINNVDVRQNIPLNDTISIDLVAGSNRTDNSITLMEILPGGNMEDIFVRPVLSGLKEVYGFCLYFDRQNQQAYAFVNDKTGLVEQWRLFGTDDLKLDAELVRTFRGGDGQLEGCVCDDDLGFFYLGEEDKGIWKFNAHPDSTSTGTLVDDMASSYLKADIEGLTIYYGADGKGYLIASSQGNNSFAVYRREGNNEYLGTFVISNAPLIDGVSETDGIDVTSASLGPAFPNGLFVAQDGYNHNGKKLVSQNFKVVDWKKIEEKLKLE